MDKEEFIKKAKSYNYTPEDISEILAAQEDKADEGLLPLPYDDILLISPGTISNYP